MEFNFTFCLQRRKNNTSVKFNSSKIKILSNILRKLNPLRNMSRYAYITMCCQLNAHLVLPKVYCLCLLPYAYELSLFRLFYL